MGIFAIVLWTFALLLAMGYITACILYILSDTIREYGGAMECVRSLGDFVLDLLHIG